MALAAQGFDRARPAPGTSTVSARDVTRTARRLGQFQIDSINVVTRAHFMPIFSRLGPYDADLLQRAAFRAPRRLFEYWGHAASLLDVQLQPLLRFRMQEGTHAWGGVDRVARDDPDLVERVRAEVSARGPVSARQLEPPQMRDRSGWGWNWSRVKTVLEWLFYRGEITSAYRNAAFERVYDLPERVLPATVLAAPDPSPDEAIRGLVRRAAAALGVATEPELRDYFRTRPGATAAAVADLVDAGELTPVIVGSPGPDPSFARPSYLWHRSRLPRRVDAGALLSPFDSLVFERNRLARLFGFHYRIEIYVPQARRRHGYYVYPFLLGDHFVARVDLKADRVAGVLRVNAAWIEEGHDSFEVAPALSAELALLAAWQGLDRVQVGPLGDLAPALAAAVAR